MRNVLIGRGIAGAVPGIVVTGLVVEEHGGYLMLAFRSERPVPVQFSLNVPVPVAPVFFRIAQDVISAVRHENYALVIVRISHGLVRVVIERSVIYTLYLGTPGFPFFVGIEIVVICSLESKGKTVGDEVQSLVYLHVDVERGVVVLFIAVAHEREVAVPA